MLSHGKRQGPDAVSIRFTPYGVAHIEADTFEAAGAGYGWVLARDNLDTVLERTITLAGERCRVLSPTDSYMDIFAGGLISNFESDAIYRYLLPDSLVRRWRRRASPELRDLVRGFVRGFNLHVEGAALPGEESREKTWFRPLHESDVWRRIAHVPLLESTAHVLREILAAEPPREDGVPTTADTSRFLGPRARQTGASNALAFGREVVADGGFSFCNPHYAWHGSERLHVFHLQVRGQLNVFGATAYGLPFPMMGFTPSVGWGITHSTDKRCTIYELALDPRSPTTYRVGRRRLKMRKAVVQVRVGDKLVDRAFWETRYGPVITGEGLAWDGARAYAFADPERGNDRFGDQFLDIARAGSVRDIRSSLTRTLGSPWSNVTAADCAGDVLFANISVAAHITDEQLRSHAVSSPARVYGEIADLTVLDGSSPGAAWTRDARAPQRGLIPGELRPSMVRADVVFNSNDSHWLCTLDPERRLEGFARVIGPERSIRGERTRLAAIYAQDVLQAGRARTTDDGIPALWESLFFSGRNLTAELILDDLLEDCDRHPVVRQPDGREIDISAAARVLRSWDRKDRLESRGSALFGVFVRRLAVVPMTGFALAPRYWRTPFDPSDPVGTPRGLVVSQETRLALAAAVESFEAAGLSLDAPLADTQAVIRNGQRIPISGSTFAYHMARSLGSPETPEVKEIRSGDSYMHLVTLRPGRVEGRFILTYSQSTNPRSPHHSDMTEVFSHQTLIDVAFSEAQIAAAQVGETVILKRRRGRARRGRT